MNQAHRALPFLAAIAFSIVDLPARAQSNSFVPPPRTIADITAVLDQQKPDTDSLQRQQRVADASPPATATKVELADFLLRRAHARAELGRSSEAVADAEEATRQAEPRTPLRASIDQFLISQYSLSRQPAKALRVLAENQGNRPTPNLRMSLGRFTVRTLFLMGRLEEAERELAALETSAAEIRAAATSEAIDLYGGVWMANVELSRGTVLAARGRWKEAEAAFGLSEAGFRDAAAKRPRWPNGPPATSQLQVAYGSAAFAAAAKREQGRLAEAEADARRALLGQLGVTGKYHPATASMCQRLAFVLRDQGRFEEMEQVLRAGLDILRVVGVAEDSEVVASILGGLADSLRSQERWVEAAAVYQTLDQTVSTWDRNRAVVVMSDPGRILTLYWTGRIAQGLEAAAAAVELQRERVGARHFNYAVAEGNFAIGLTLAQRDAEARAAFARALPGLTVQSNDADSGENASTPTRRQRAIGKILEAYLALLVRQADTPQRTTALSGETFPLADILRGRSVAAALAASSARTVSQDSALAEIARREQDLRKQIGATFGLLNNALALPPADRAATVIDSLRAQIDGLREEHAKTHLDISVRFPAYADLIDPKPATAEQVRESLRPNEAFLSFYFGADRSFVWVVPKAGPAAFAVIAASAGDIEARVKKLRAALEPDAASVADIPAFDVAAASELYALLLKPVEAAWRPAKNLIVATNGALGLLPLGVLPTAPVALPADAGAAFAAYRGVPWLARTHAVSLVPSAAAFRTLRQLPASAAGRQPLIGFGDPLFNREQAAEAEKAVPPPASRDGTPLERRSAPHVAGLATATLASLPALPDTADELRSVATALRTDGNKVLNLGKAASEENVARADLSNYRVVAFATHGLVAGELDGLHQPALALSAPSVTGGDGDGLLTLEKILGLKLDADWVVLSACNTGAGDGAGAEAASGLGRAFFYAGTRAILVTNWSVHSQSARDLVTDLFRRQSADPRLSRAEALREAMMGLMDGPGFRDAKGSTVFTYAHPLFWAPYTIIGDGG